MEWQELLNTYGYLLFYLLLVVEGQPIYWLAGFLLAVGVFDIIPLLFGPIFIFLGDYLFYLLGLKLGSRTVEKIGKYIFLTPKRVHFIKKFLLTHRRKSFILSKYIYGIGHNTMLVFGIVKGKFRQAAPWTLIGGTTSYIVYTVLGYYLGEGYGYAKEILKEASLVLVIAIVLGFIIFQYRFRRQEESQINS